jgi:hypothetical protein
MYSTIEHMEVGGRREKWRVERAVEVRGGGGDGRRQEKWEGGKISGEKHTLCSKAFAVCSVLSEDKLNLFKN